MRSSEGLGVSKLTTTNTTRPASIPQIMGVFAKRPSRTMKITTTTLPAAMDAKAPASGSASPEQGAYYRHEKGTTQEVVSHRQSTYYIAYDQRDNEDNDADKQGSHAANQYFVVVTPGDKAGVNVVGEEGGGGQESSAGGGHHGGERRGQDQASDPHRKCLGSYPGEGVVRRPEVGEDHPRRGPHEGACQSVEQAVDACRNTAPACDRGAAGGEHPLPDVLPDHQPEEEEQEVREDRLPPDRRDVEVGGR